MEVELKNLNHLNLFNYVTGIAKKEMADFGSDPPEKYQIFITVICVDW
jgi:hypothetical protein